MAQIDFIPQDHEAIQPGSSGPIIPDGWYICMLVDSAEKTSKTGGSRYIDLRFEVDETRHPTFAGKQLFDRLNLWNAKPEVQRMARGILRSICDALGMPAGQMIQDTSELHGRFCAVRVVTKPAEMDPATGQQRYGAKNEIKGYRHVDATDEKPAAQAQAAAKPTAPAPTTAPAAAAPRGPMPWEARK